MAQHDLQRVMRGFSLVLQEAVRLKVSYSGCIGKEGHVRKDRMRGILFTDPSFSNLAIGHSVLSPFLLFTSSAGHGGNDSLQAMPWACC